VNRYTKYTASSDILRGLLVAAGEEQKLLLLLALVTRR
jgi:hypothetical protein